jgi:hypothetical protein
VHIARASTVRFIKSLWLRWCGHVARIKNQRIPKQISTAIMEGIRKIGRPRKRWRDKVEGYLKLMGIKNRQTMPRDRWKWRKIILEAKVHGELWRFRRIRRRRRRRKKKKKKPVSHVL